MLDKIDSKVAKVEGAVANLNTTVTEQDRLAVGVAEDRLLSLDSCGTVSQHQKEFVKSLDWSGTVTDTQRSANSLKPGYAIEVVVRKTPRLAVCTVGFH